MADHNYKRRPVLHWAALLLFIFGGMGFGGWQLMVHPQTPLPPEWNPTVPLVVTDPVTSLTQWKLSRALGGRESCLAALQTGAEMAVLPDFEDSTQCHIRPQVALEAAGGIGMASLNTRCQTGLRLAMWHQHGVRPAAQEHLSEDIRRVQHFSSYNCRAMRTSDGDTGRMSTHATADAIDISGFVTTSGQRISLKAGWTGPVEHQLFLRAVRDSACTWFRVTLGPDYNALHADHFHLQHTGWGLCR